MRIVAFVAFAALFACGSGSGPIIFDFPPTADRGTEILTADDGKSVKGFAISLDHRSIRLPLNIESDRTTRLEAMIYDQTPAQLGVVEGELIPHPEGTATLPPRILFQTSARDGEVDPWTPLQTPSQLSKPFLPAIGCAKFQTAPVFIGSEFVYCGGAALNASSALLIARSSTDTVAHYYLANEQGVRRTDDLFPGMTPRKMLHVPGAEGSSGTLFVAVFSLPNEDRTMLAGDLARGFTPIPPRPLISECPVTGMDYARDGSPSPAIFVVDQCGNVDRFENGAWTTLRDATDIEFGEEIAWVAPNELVWSTQFGRELRRIKNGVDELTPTDIGVDDVTVVSTIDGAGTFAGLASGWVLKYNGSSWGTFRPPFIATVGARSLAAYEGGMLIGGSDGDIQHWIDPDFCDDPTYVGIDLSIADIVPLDFGIVVAGEQLLHVSNDYRFFAAVLKRDE